MDTKKLLKLLVVTNLVTLLLASASAYFAMEARDSADDAYLVAESASNYASSVEDILNRR